MQVVFNDYAQGDVRIVSLRITPRTPYGPPAQPLTVVSGSWTAVQAQTGNSVTGDISPTSGSVSINTKVSPYSFVSTAAITWTTAGSYVLRFALVWSDGTEDNTLSALIPVDLPAI